MRFAEVCRSCGPLAKSFRCGRAGHSQQRGCFPRSPHCPFLPICLQVCPYGESRVAVLTFKSSSMHVSTGRGCVRARRPEPAAVFNQRHILSYHSVSATPVRRTRRSLSSRPILLTPLRCPQVGSSYSASRYWGPTPPRRACPSPPHGGTKSVGVPAPAVVAMPNLLPPKRSDLSFPLSVWAEI